MTIKHTPGPWIARREYSGESGRWYIRGISDEWIGAVSSANARLIAAAPDLLEALKELMPWVDGVYGGKHPNLVAVRAVENAHYAITKVEGKEAE